MTFISPQAKLADVIHRDYLLLSVVNRFGIRLGFGDKSIRHICEEAGVDPEFFTAILNTFNSANYFAEKKLMAFPILQILDYLRKTHDYYRDIELKIIDVHLNVLIESEKNAKELALIKRFFEEYKTELLLHLKREEERTFPYIETLVSYKGLENGGELFRELSKKYSIRVFKREHDNVDEKLFDLKNIIIKYLNNDYDQSSCNAVIFELFKLEKDLIEHTKLEDKILIPMVEALEEELKGKQNEQK